jgi:serine protease Do
LLSEKNINYKTQTIFNSKKVRTKMKLKNFLLVVAVSASTAILSVWGYGKWMMNHYDFSQAQGKLPANYAGFFGDKGNSGAPVDFTSAASSATPAVVHIKTKTKAHQVTNNLPKQNDPFAQLFGENDPFAQFFGGPQSQMVPEQRASGSGVLISDDGYIVTNNHVIEDADEIAITTSDRKTYKGVVVAADPNTDLAVLKIEGNNLPYLVYGNSDDVRIGQWVLAIGYPLTLDVTVTAGIISAKSRRLGLNQSNQSIESFLQTDAAVNPGNSGGALINTDGQLIGINSAIASPTGSYAGYSYAIPVNIVKKIVNDLIKFGAVQRAYLGIMMSSDKDGTGVYVADVMEGSSAKDAGLKTGDFITKVNGTSVNSGPELQEQITGYKPGDKISLTYIRDGKEKTVDVVLKNTSGNTSIVRAQNLMDKIGGQLDNLDAGTAKKNNVAGGVVVKKIGEGLLKNTRMQEGFVITSVNGAAIKNLDDLTNVLAKVHGTVQLNGFYPGYDGNYGYPLSLEQGGDSDDNGQ